MIVRVKFTKKGRIRFIGHLDLMRYFQKATKRADLDLKYSQGFNPHQLMSFAFPLSVGMESEGEYFDLELNSLPTKEEFLNRMNAAMAEGIVVEDVKLLPEKCKNAMASVSGSIYRVSFYSKLSFLDQVREVYENGVPLSYRKETKEGAKEFSLRDHIHSFSVDSEKQTITMLVDSGSMTNIKAAYVVEAIADAMHLEDPKRTDFLKIHITRIDTLMTNDAGEFVSLGAVGEDF